MFPGKRTDGLQPLAFQVVHLLVAADSVLLDIFLVELLNRLLDGLLFFLEDGLDGVVVEAQDGSSEGEEEEQDDDENDPFHRLAFRLLGLHALAVAVDDFRLDGRGAGLFQAFLGAAFESVAFNQAFTADRTTADTAMSHGQTVGVVQTYGAIDGISIHGGFSLLRDRRTTWKNL